MENHFLGLHEYRKFLEAGLSRATDLPVFGCHSLPVVSVCKCRSIFLLQVQPSSQALDHAALYVAYSCQRHNRKRVSDRRYKALHRYIVTKKMGSVEVENMGRLFKTMTLTFLFRQASHAYVIFFPSLDMWGIKEVSGNAHGRPIKLLIKRSARSCPKTLTNMIAHCPS